MRLNLILPAILMLGLLGSLLSVKELTRGSERTFGQQYNAGNANRGRALIEQYGCSACHTVAGVDQARAKIGPPLNGIGTRMTIAGRLPNTPENLIRWIQNPQEEDPGNIMPDLNVSDKDAQDIATYLYSLP